MPWVANSEPKPKPELRLSHLAKVNVTVTSSPTATASSAGGKPGTGPERVGPVGLNPGPIEWIVRRCRRGGQPWEDSFGKHLKTRALGTGLREAKCQLLCRHGSPARDPCRLCCASCCPAHLDEVMKLQVQLLPRSRPEVIFLPLILVVWVRPSHSTRCKPSVDVDRRRLPPVRPPRRGRCTLASVGGRSRGCCWSRRTTV